MRSKLLLFSFLLALTCAAPARLLGAQDDGCTIAASPSWQEWPDAGRERTHYLTRRWELVALPAHVAAAIIQYVPANECGYVTDNGGVFWWNQLDERGLRVVGLPVGEKGAEDTNAPWELYGVKMGARVAKNVVRKAAQALGREGTWVGEVEEPVGKVPAERAAAIRQLAASAGWTNLTDHAVARIEQRNVTVGELARLRASRPIFIQTRNGAKVYVLRDDGPDPFLALIEAVDGAVPSIVRGNKAGMEELAYQYRWRRIPGTPPI